MNRQNANCQSMGQQELMRAMMEYSFAIVDLGLYLDTHPDDRESIETYKSLRDTYEKYRMEYARRFGPIVQTDVTGDNRFTWISQPWPWEGGR